MDQVKEERPPRIFRYWNGVDFVYGDPLRIQRELYIKLGDPDAAFDASEKTATVTTKTENGEEKIDVLTAEAYAAKNIINDNAREAFGMVPFDPKTGTGATDEDVEEALSSLWEYMEKKSTNTGTKPSSEPSTTLTPTPSLTKP